MLSQSKKSLGFFLDYNINIYMFHSLDELGSVSHFSVSILVLVVHLNSSLFFISINIYIYIEILQI